MPRPTATEPVDRATWMVAGTVVFGSILSSLDTTAVNVALDTLARDFGTPITSVQWVSTAYLLALAAVIPLSGWAEDRFGGKRVWMTSIGLFVTRSRSQSRCTRRRRSRATSSPRCGW
jgi:MFS family permease